MAALSKKLRSLEGGRVMFWCPGCDGAHQVSIGAGPGPRWGFNGDAERPTFTPSILVRGSLPITDDQVSQIMAGKKFEPVPLVCHCFVRDGLIEFLGDCTHALAGQTVEIPDFEKA